MGRTKKPKPKEWTYHRAHSYTDLRHNSEVTCMTEIYPASGVYAILKLNGKDVQRIVTPGKMVEWEKTILERQAKGEIGSLIWGKRITVTVDNHNVFYKEKEEDSPQIKSCQVHTT